MLGDRLREAAAGHRPAGEAAEAAQPIVHDDGAGGGDDHLTSVFLRLTGGSALQELDEAV